MRLSSLGSNRRFGLLLVVACVLVFGWGLSHGSRPIGWFITGLVLSLITLFMPRILAPLKRLWLKLGGLAHVVVSPILLAGFYYLAVTPIGLVLRLLGKDPMRRRPGPGTYWVERKPPGPDPKTMPELF
jgi:multisubunit Na+/H+ antiporter MnhE subunit